MEKQTVNNQFIIFLLICRWSWKSIYEGQRTHQETRPSDLYPLSDVRAGAGVSHQSIPHKATKDRNGPSNFSHWTPNQDLVSKSKSQNQKGDYGNQGAQWARQTRSGSQRISPWPSGTTRRRPNGPLIFRNITFYHSFCPVRPLL